LSGYLDISTTRISTLGREGILPHKTDRRYRMNASCRAYVAWSRNTPKGGRGERLDAAALRKRWTSYTANLRAAVLAAAPRFAAQLGLD